MNFPAVVSCKCLSDFAFGQHYIPTRKKDLLAARGAVEALQSDYFAPMDVHWEKMKKEGRTDVDDWLSLQYVRTLKIFMDKTSLASMKIPTAPGKVKFRQDLKEAEAASIHTLSKYCTTLEACAHHFGAVQRQHEAREKLETSLPPTSMVLQLDYMENQSWPLGPEESQDWYWATSRQSMTTVGFYATFWKGGVQRKQYHHYISCILNHDSAYANQCLFLGFAFSYCKTL